MISIPALTPAQARWHRLTRQGLVTPLAGAEAVAGALAGVQAQILPAAGVAIWNRARPFTAADLARQLYAERRLVKLWGQRSTLHLYPSADWPLVYGAQSDTGTYWERTSARGGADMEAHEALVAAVADLLRERECVGRSDLRAAGLPLDDDHLSGWGGIFTVLVRRGLACHAAPRDGEARMAHRARWLPDLVWAP
ncbi:MAG: winged helix DNA-binding domain-containing protein, partial [Chloroflexales bacterium]|nr:winged helix DNA-binding domain-containing protein [Chloroflexales bacterium]